MNAIYTDNAHEMSLNAVYLTIRLNKNLLHDLIHGMKKTRIFPRGKNVKAAETIH